MQTFLLKIKYLHRRGSNLSFTGLLFGCFNISHLLFIFSARMLLFSVEVSRTNKLSENNTKLIWLEISETNERLSKLFAHVHIGSTVKHYKRRPLSFPPEQLKAIWEQYLWLLLVSNGIQINSLLHFFNCSFRPLLIVENSKINLVK